MYTGQPGFHSQPQFNVQPRPQHHGGYTPSPAQYYAPHEPQPHHASAMPLAQHCDPDYWPAAGPPAFPQPDRSRGMALDGSMEHVPSYIYAPTPLLTPAGSIASSEHSSGPSTPRVFMPYPSIPRKQPDWVTDVPDGRQPIHFPEARHY